MLRQKNLICQEKIEPQAKNTAQSGKMVNVDGLYAIVRDALAAERGE